MLKVQPACHRIREDPEWGSILNILKNQVLIGVVELHVSLCPSWPSYVSSSKDKREGTPIQVSSSLWLPYLMLIQWLSIIGPTM